MPSECSAYGCYNYRTPEARKRGISFHKFPNAVSDSVRREEWIVRVRRLDRKRKGLWQPGVTAVICSEHFLPNDFHQQFGRKTLKLNASPSVFSFAPLKKPRKAPTKRSTGPSPSASKTTTTDTADSNESVDIKEVLTNIYVDHAYAVTSPTKLKKQNDSLVQVLEKKNAEIRNLRRRELTKTGKIEQVIRELKDGIDSHVYSLIRQIVRFYLDVRKRHYANMYNLENRGASVRQSLNKLVLFKNQ